MGPGGTLMCELILPEPHLMPGWACCRDRVYNGLQRERCKACQAFRHDTDLRDRLVGPTARGEVLLCPTCGAGYGPQQIPQDGQCLVSWEGVGPGGVGPGRCTGMVGGPREGEPCRES